MNRDERRKIGRDFFVKARYVVERSASKRWWFVVDRFYDQRRRDCIISMWETRKLARMKVKHLNELYNLSRLERLNARCSNG